MKTPKEKAEEAEKELRKNPQINEDAIKLINEFGHWSNAFTRLIKKLIKSLKDDN